jgi:glutamyl-Q tRNA(Asp) synthetase
LSVIGRFAPSPTGVLHFGSLVAATASYLQVRQARGRWLLRIEDLDKPREQAGATEQIIQTLRAFAFEWDGEIVLQSQRQAAYYHALHQLKPFLYACDCSRKVLQQTGRLGAYGWIYAGTCRAKALTCTHAAIRLRTHEQIWQFTDLIRGDYAQNLAQELGDFVILRADKIFAYQLAVVVDDAYQGVNQIVRGADLLDNTPRQLYLQHLLGFRQPTYAHVPLVIDAQTGQKLSKQNLAPAIHAQAGLNTLVSVLRFLGQQPPNAYEFANLNEFWDWAIANWSLQAVPKVQTQPVTLF